MVCFYVFSVLAHSELAVHRVYSMTETHHSGQEGLGHPLLSDQLHFSLDLCHELSTLSCWAVHQDGKPPLCF